MKKKQGNNINNLWLALTDKNTQNFLLEEQSKYNMN